MFSDNSATLTNKFHVIDLRFKALTVAHSPRQMVFKVRRDYQRRCFLIVSLARPCLTLERHQQQELANDRC